MSPMEQAALDWLEELAAAKKLAPANGEIASHFNLGANVNAQRLVEELETAGKLFVERGPNWRVITLITSGRELRSTMAPSPDRMPSTIGRPALAPGEKRKPAEAGPASRRISPPRESEMRAVDQEIIRDRPTKPVPELPLTDRQGEATTAGLAPPTVPRVSEAPSPLPPEPEAAGSSLSPEPLPDAIPADGPAQPGESQCGESDRSLYGDTEVNRLAKAGGSRWGDEDRAIRAARCLQIIELCKISDSSAIEAINDLVELAGTGFARQALEVQF